MQVMEGSTNMAVYSLQLILNSSNIYKILTYTLEQLYR